MPTAFDGFTVADRSTELPVVADPGAVTDNEVVTFGSTTVTDCADALEFVNPAAPVNSAVTANEPAALN
ncbi:hypothetical protein, partial [Prescottella equi]|uniref:hypothetical protein n=1 Tax=Rhodococcus hoagii TaxID=43767 RepID=UPI001F3F2E76